LRIDQPPSQSRKATIGFSGLKGLFALRELTQAENPDSVQRLYEDEERNGCAHSCGAVAELHRLPEHPGDRENVLSRSTKLRQRCHRIDFDDINFYSGCGARSQRLL